MIHIVRFLTLSIMVLMFVSLGPVWVVADEPKFTSTQLKASSELPDVVLNVWQNTPDRCSEGYDPDQDFVADLFGTVVEGRDNNKIYILPCGAPAAYNSSEIVIAVNSDNSEARIFAIPSISEQGISADIIGPGLQWDVETSVLTSFYKGRGLGDCGGNSALFWDGEYYTSLILLEQYSKLECDGKYDEWPKIWPLD